MIVRYKVVLLPIQSLLPSLMCSNVTARREQRLNKTLIIDELLLLAGVQDEDGEIYIEVPGQIADLCL